MENNKRIKSAYYCHSQCVPAAFRHIVCCSVLCAFERSTVSSTTFSNWEKDFPLFSVFFISNRKEPKNNTWRTVSVWTEHSAIVFFFATYLTVSNRDDRDPFHIWRFKHDRLIIVALIQWHTYKYCDLGLALQHKIQSVHFLRISFRIVNCRIVDIGFNSMAVGTEHLSVMK